MYKVRLKGNILVDKNYHFAEALQLLKKDLPNPKIGGKIVRSFDKYWVASYLKNTGDEIFPINSEACYEELYMDGRKIELSSTYTRPDPRGIILQDQILQSYFNLAPGTTHLIVAKISDFHLSKNFNPVISDSRTYEGNILKKEKQDIYLLIFLSSLYALLLLFSLGIFLLWKDKTFLFYSIFCFVTWFHFSRNLGENYETYDFINLYLPWVYIKVPIFLSFYISYILFTNFYIRAHERYPDEYRFSKYFIGVLVLLSLPEFLFLYTGQLPLSYSYYFCLRFVATLVAIYFLFLISKYKDDHLVQIMMVGGGGLLFSELFSSIFDRSTYRYVIYATMLIEVVAFIYGILYKLYLQTKERILLQQSKSLSDQLIKQLHDSTNTLSRTFLQYQLNPHFIFNCLNSIKEMVVSKENTMASKYISKFSNLVRTILDNSQKTEVSLTQSMDFLAQYLDMEKMRFPKLNYSIQISENIDPHDITIPPAILQPLVENAIVHGYENNKNEAVIEISIYKVAQHFLIDITDYGQGLNKSKSRIEKLGNHNTLATKNIENQIDLLNQKYGTDYQLEIIDKITAGHPTPGVISRLTFTNRNLIEW